MENRHRQILGYRDLDAIEIAMMNEIKAKGHELGALFAKLQKHIAEHDTSPEAVERSRITEPFRWLARAKTAGQDSIMYAVRAVAQPDDGF